MLIGWTGRGYFVIFIVALAMFAPLVVLRQIDGEAVDRAVSLAMTIAAAGTATLGFWLNRAALRGEPSAHTLCRLPMQAWALPMAVFAILLATGVLNTAEDPAPANAGGTTLTRQFGS